jgi:hypothetical protein
VGSAVAAAIGLLWATTAPAVVITVGSATGTAGDDVTITVSLDTEGEMVLATQNRIDFTRSAAIAANGEGQPDCTVNPAIDKNASGFRFLPLPCNPALDCQSVRVFVIAFDNLDPIPDGSNLYSCRVLIAANATPGQYALQNAETASSAAGGVLLETTGIGGQVEVVLPSPTPSPTSTPIISNTPTHTPTPTASPSVTPTETGTTPACAGDCNGDREVRINELLTGVNISSGETTLDVCAVFDADGDLSVEINELILAVNRALNGCGT